MSLDLNRIKALCFDVDGTLSDTDDLYTQKVTRFFPRPIFKDPSRAARRFVMWMEAPGNALLGLADTVGLDDEMVAVIHWLSLRRKHFPKKIPAGARRGRNAQTASRKIPHVGGERAG